MATRYWIGQVNNNFGTAANWTGATVPVNGDAIWFPYKSKFGVTDGLDQSGKTFSEVVVTCQYEGYIGKEGTYLTCGADMISMRGNGNVYIDGSGSDVGEVNCFSGKLSVRTATGDDFRVFGGTLHIEAGSLTTLTVIPTNTDNTRRVKQPEIIIAGSAGTVTTAKQFGGIIINRSTITTLELNSGTCIVDRLPTAGDLSATCKIKGGVLDWRSSTSDLGSRVLEVYGGTVTTENFDDAQVSLDIGQIDLYAGTVDLRTGYGNVYCGSESAGSGTLNIMGDVYQLFLDAGRKVTIADQ